MNDFINSCINILPCTYIYKFIMFEDEKSEEGEGYEEND